MGTCLLFEISELKIRLHWCILERCKLGRSIQEIRKCFKSRWCKV